MGLEALGVFGIVVPPIQGDGVLTCSVAHAASGRINRLDKNKARGETIIF